MVAEARVERVEITYSSVWPLAVPAMNEFLTQFEHPGFVLVSYVDGFYLTCG